ncbi:MAG TPA: extracellular solute-binding protein [Kiritimatiellia bacterium]|nr:extracellular solute-binding protein [Kiritimatiellia bacterium]
MKMIVKRVTGLLVVGGWLAGAGGYADREYPGPGWEDRPNPLASPEAVPGGTIAIYAHQYPKSFNYLLDANVFSADLFGNMFDSLLSLHPITVEFEPGLAERWVISPDKKTFTFHLDPRARWSDGTPIAAEDVVFTYDTIMNPAHLTGPHKVGLEPFDRPEALDERTVRFTAREVHWRNLNALGGLSVLPKHAMEGKDFNRIHFEFPVVSGPYRLGEIREGISVRLERREDWWARELPRHQGVANFQTLLFRFFSEQENAYEAFRQGLLDVFPVYMSRIWMNEAQGERFDRNWIVKQKIYNDNPIGFQGFAMNLRRAPYDDVRVRKALAHLLNREKMNQTIMYNQYFMHRSYFEDLYLGGAMNNNPEFGFDPGRARTLLEEAGWSVNPRNGLLEKDGQPLVVTFLTRDPGTDKFLAIYSEDLKDVGITLRIDRKDWAAWKKDMDEFNFEMTWAAWSGGLFKDPEHLWLSREADRPSGNNITGFKSDEVDRLIEMQRGIFDVSERHELVRQIDEILTREVPYILLWNIDYTRLLYWNKFGMPDTVLSRFGDERSAYSLWWFDEDQAADLEAAMADRLPLPPRPVVVRFHEMFSGE